MLKQNQQRALKALLTCPTRTQAAEQAGLSMETLRRYLADAEFMAEYKRQFSEVVTDATRQAQQALHPALTALQDIVNNPNESASARIAAARSILEFGLKLTEINDILKTLEGTFDDVL